MSLVYFYILSMLAQFVGWNSVSISRNIRAFQDIKMRLHRPSDEDCNQNIRISRILLNKSKIDKGWLFRCS